MFLLLLLLLLLHLLLLSSRASIRTLSEPLARCLLGPDIDEMGLLSKARPLLAKPLNAVTRVRDWLFGCLC